MSKRFLISEDERNSILSLYAKKGIILEQDFTTGDKTKKEPEDDYEKRWKRNEKDSNLADGVLFETPGFNNIRYGITLKNGTLYYDHDQSNESSYPKFPRTPVNFGGNNKNFTVNLINNKITNSEFIENQKTVAKWGGFASVRREFQPERIDGFQVFMINWPTSMRDPKFPRFEPDLCTVLIGVGDIYRTVNDSYHHPRTPVDFPIINFSEYYIPKSKKEWYTIRTKVGVLYTGGVPSGDDPSSMSFKEFKKRKLAVYLTDYWPGQSLGTVVEPEPQPIPPPRFIPRSVGGNVGEPFIFNKTDLASGGEAQIKKFVDQFLFLKRTDPDLYDTYIKELNKKYEKTGINVYAYSSIDNDPNEIITYVEGIDGNAVDKCGGKQLRSLYNKCLSDRRAEVIAARLNKDLPDFPDFIGIGKGESKSVNGVGWTKENPTTEPQTLPNRRFEVDLPEYSDVKSVGNN
jgi:hypothetical protein